MKRKIAIALVALSTIACGKKQQETTATTPTEQTTNTSDYLCVPMKQAGKILATHTITDIEQLFGKENVSLDSVFAEGEFVRLQTVVHKAKPEEVFIAWLEDAPPFKKIMSVSVRQKNSPYKTAEGIGVGATTGDLQAKLYNGKPFKFSGFGWDYGGSCCFTENNANNPTLVNNLGFVLDMAEGKYQQFTEEESKQFLGDQQVSSDLPVFKKAMPTVIEMTVALNEYDPEG